jgi:hypothetical protein
VLLHELGHAMGLGHTPSSAEVMNPVDQGHTTYQAGDSTGSGTSVRRRAAPASTGRAPGPVPMPASATVAGVWRRRPPPGSGVGVGSVAAGGLAA